MDNFWYVEISLKSWTYGLLFSCMLVIDILHEIFCSFLFTICVDFLLCNYLHSLTHIWVNMNHTLVLKWEKKEWYTLWGYGSLHICNMSRIMTTPLLLSSPTCAYVYYVFRLAFECMDRCFPLCANLEVVYIRDDQDMMLEKWFETSIPLFLYFLLCSF